MNETAQATSKLGWILSHGNNETGVVSFTSTTTVSSVADAIVLAVGSVDLSCCNVTLVNFGGDAIGLGALFASEENFRKTIASFGAVHNSRLVLRTPSVSRKTCHERYVKHCACRYKRKKRFRGLLSGSSDDEDDEESNESYHKRHLRAALASQQPWSSRALDEALAALQDVTAKTTGAAKDGKDPKHRAAVERALSFVELHALRVFQSSRWPCLSSGVVWLILSRDRLNTGSKDPELQVFKALVSWVEANITAASKTASFSKEELPHLAALHSDLQDWQCAPLWRSIRFPAMTSSELAQVSQLKINGSTPVLSSHALMQLFTAVGKQMGFDEASERPQRTQEYLGFSSQARQPREAQCELDDWRLHMSSMYEAQTLDTVRRILTSPWTGDNSRGAGTGAQGGMEWVQASFRRPVCVNKLELGVLGADWGSDYINSASFEYQERSGEWRYLLAISGLDDQGNVRKVFHIPKDQLKFAKDYRIVRSDGDFLGMSRLRMWGMRLDDATDNDFDRDSDTDGDEKSEWSRTAHRPLLKPQGWSILPAAWSCDSSVKNTKQPSSAAQSDSKAGGTTTGPSGIVEEKKESITLPSTSIEQEADVSTRSDGGRTAAGDSTAETASSNASSNASAAADSRPDIAVAQSTSEEKTQGSDKLYTLQELFDLSASELLRHWRAKVAARSAAMEEVFRVVDIRMESILSCSEWVSLSAPEMQLLCGRETLNCDECRLCAAVVQWAAAQLPQEESPSVEVLQNVLRETGILSLLRFSSMNEYQLASLGSLKPPLLSPAQVVALFSLLGTKNSGSRGKLPEDLPMNDKGPRQRRTLRTELKDWQLKVSALYDTQGTTYTEENAKEVQMALTDGNRFTGVGADVKGASTATFIEAHFGQQRTITEIELTAVPPEFSCGWGPLYADCKLQYKTNRKEKWTDLCALSNFVETEQQRFKPSPPIKATSVRAIRESFLALSGFRFWSSDIDIVTGDREEKEEKHASEKTKDRYKGLVKANLLKQWRSAMLVSLDSASIAFEWLEAHAQVLFTSEEWLSASDSEVRTILSSPYLNTPGEAAIVEAAIRWALTRENREDSKASKDDTSSVRSVLKSLGIFELLRFKALAVDEISYLSRLFASLGVQLLNTDEMIGLFQHVSTPAGEEIGVETSGLRRRPRVLANPITGWRLEMSSQYSSLQNTYESLTDGRMDTGAGTNNSGTLRFIQATFKSVTKITRVRLAHYALGNWGPPYTVGTRLEYKDGKGSSWKHVGTVSGLHDWTPHKDITFETPLQATAFRVASDNRWIGLSKLEFYGEQ